ncbi:MAG: Lrp/AsnC family transcriptional regulator [Candidatus Woesearchaeota archaeon]|jgi:DNA-binding Lrp family transcriptional regulator|nr:Lrp/AsnC family transcriptional regulator [Candidatus Woesearchaeota archaeon]MDP7457675.1 Lrp/AsnC family transcriptional regulator [Candidatus Woesearchaeota archaeon]
MKKYGLDLLDRKILFQLDLDSRQSYKALGKKLSVAKETIAFRIKRLKKTGYIKGFLTAIHVSNLNRYYYKLFYKFHKTTPAIDKQIVNFIKEYQGIAYFASLEGRYDITFLVLSKTMTDLYNFLLPFREKFGDYILEQEILTMPEGHRFNFRFFHDEDVFHQDRFQEQMQEAKIDKTDYLIVKTLAENARISLIDLAKITKRETNVVKYRLKKLKSQDILGTHVLDINFEKFGLQHIQVCFTLKNHGVVAKLLSFASQMNQSTFATVTLGKYDLALEFVVEGSKELRLILNKIKQKFSQDIIDHDVFILEEHLVNWFPYEMEKKS